MLTPIILAGSLLRFWHLGTWSFWIDEVFTVLDAQQFALSDFRINPLPYLAVKFSMSIAGTHEWGARFISCLVGIISLPLLFLMGRSFFNARVGLFAAAFLAFSNWHIFWSQNARASYALTFLFAALTAWSFYLALERDSLLLIGCSLVSVLCLVLSHLLSVMLIPALAGYVISFWIPLRLDNRSQKPPLGIRPRNLLVFFTPFALPILLLVLPKVHRNLFSGWGLNEWQRSPVYILFTLVYGLSVPLAVASFFSSFTKPIDRAKWFLICYAGIPLTLFLIASRLLNVAGYYLFFTTPAYFLLAAVGCEQISRSTQIPRLFRYVLPCIIVATMMSQNYLYFRVENGGRPKWREAFETIQSQMRAGDRVVVSAPRICRYYLPEIEPIAAKAIIDDTEGFDKEWETGDVRVWFVIDAANFGVFDSAEGFRDWVRRRGRLIRTFPVFARAMDRTISVYLRDNTGIRKRLDEDIKEQK